VKVEEVYPNIFAILAMELKVQFFFSAVSARDKSLKKGKVPVNQINFIISYLGQSFEELLTKR